MIELLLAMAIGSLILTSLTQVVMASKTTYRLQNGLSQLQSSGRLAVDLLSEDIRMSGFRGCSSSQTNSLHSMLAPPWRDSLTSNFHNYALEGMDDYDGEPSRYADDRPFANRDKRGQPVAGSDVLIVRRPVGRGLTLLQDSTHQAGHLRVHFPAGEKSVKSGDLLLISDCNRSRVFQATGSWKSADTLDIGYSGDWAARDPGFSTGASIYRLDTRLYYIRRGTRGYGSSLYLKQGSSASFPQELIEGVEDLQLLYGIGERHGRGLALRHFLDASEVEAGQLWDQVVSVRLRLQLASLQTHLVVDDAVGDGRLRREFSTLVTLRNRAL